MPTSVVFGNNEKWRINRNILVLGFAFMVQFTAFHGAANLQSSVNTDASAGIFTLAAIYFSLILSNIFLPAIVIKWLGCKWTVAVSFIAYMPFIAAQFYPYLHTLVPAGMMVGFGGGPLWCAKCTYLSVVAEPYAKLSGVSAEVLVVRFFGLFFMFYQMAQIWGNLVSSAILSSSLGEISTYVNESLQDTPRAVALASNFSMPTPDYGGTCGVNFCSGSASHDATNSNLAPPSTLKIQVIAGVYLACMATAILLVVIGVDSLTRYDTGRKSITENKSGLSLLAVTLRQLRHKYQLLLLPVIGYIGAEQAFMAADFTQAFVTCAYGISNIGFVMICFGVFNALAAPVAGAVVKVTGRFPVMVTALILNLCLLTSLLLWRPNPEQWFIFYGLAAIWGTADAVWLVQVNALSGILFPGSEEAAYSNFRLWEATGSVLSYATAPYLCVRTRLYILAGLLILGFSGYSTIELMEYRILNLCLLTSLLLWRPNPEQWFIFYGLAAIWGTADAVWLVQVNALSGILFPGSEEAAYSNFRLWEATGSVLSYATAPYLCVRTRLYILAGLLILGFSGYSTIELMEYRVKRRHHQERNFELVSKKPTEE